jgi:GAF domain-containing protein
MQEMQTWQGYRNFSTQEKANGRGTGGIGETRGAGETRKLGGTGRTEEMGKGVASVFYADVLRSYVNLTGVLRFWAISNLVLRQAREQLDPQRLGIEITIARCMPPYQGKKIRSMYECMRIGTPPWEHRREDTLLFLGAESLAGYAVSMSRPAVIQNLAQNAYMPDGSVQAYEQSLAAYPVMRAGNIAGCLIAASTRPDYFLETQRLQLLQHYTELIALAFEPEEFYLAQQIELCVMPSADVQRLYLANMQQRIAQIMSESVVKSQPINSLEAERLAWQQLEEELFQRPFTFEE